MKPHRCTAGQVAILEPVLPERVLGTCLKILREATDDGHLRLELAIVFQEKEGAVFSDGALKAIDRATNVIFKPDWNPRRLPKASPTSPGSKDELSSAQQRIAPCRLESRRNLMMIKTLAFIHTSPVLVPTFTQLAGELLPELNVFHMVDESLIKNTIAAGHLTKPIARRVLSLIASAEQAGAEAVMVTCSSIGQAVTLSRPFIEVPVLRIDEAMAEAAVAKGPRIGVAATLRTTLDPTLQLLEATARQAGKSIETVPCLCEGAFEAVISGQTDRHDSLVREALLKLMKSVDVVVLAQASMARVLSSIPADGTPILSSPRLAIERARQQLLEPR